MKKTTLIFASLMMLIFFNACDNKKQVKEGLSDLQIQMEAERKADSLINDAINKSKLPDSTAPMDTFKKAIEIIKYYTSSPNSACGVDCNIIWKNLAKKTVKYAKFTVVPCNAVNDEVNGDYDNGVQKLSVTGPIKTNKTSGYDTYWECTWYNCTIDYMKIIGIEIEYLDGSKISTSDVKIINALGYVRKPNN